MEITKINNSDIDEVVHIHNLAFSDFFLTQLGNRFLKLYYRTVNNAEDGVLFGSFDEGILVGFCAVTTKSKGFNSRVIKANILSYSFIGFSLLISRPKALFRLIRNFTKTNPYIIDEGDYAELLSIGVNPTIQNKGVGKQLLSKLESELGKKKIKQLSLTTDYYNNEKALGFYKSLGYEIMYEFTAYPNRKMYRLIKQL